MRVKGRMETRLAGGWDLEGGRGTGETEDMNRLGEERLAFQGRERERRSVYYVVNSNNDNNKLDIIYRISILLSSSC